MEWTGVEVSRLRNRLKLSRKQLAQLLGVNVRSVHRWENEQSKPTGAAEAILAALRLKLDNDPNSTKPVLKMIHGVLAVGGLTYFILRLLNGLTPPKRYVEYH